MATDAKTGNDAALQTGESRLFSVAPGAPFLKTLAIALLDGELVAGFAPRNDPLLLAQATIYLPTRRAARSLASEFIDAMGGRAAILPTIRTLGDSDDDEFAGFSDVGFGLGSLPVIGDLERKLRLAKLVRQWTTSLSQATRQLFGDEDIVIPSSAPEAIAMAGDLALLMDAMATEEIGWQAMDGLAGERASPQEHPERWAQWWNLTVHFLSIVTKHWPDILQELGQSDPAQERRRLLDLRTARLLEAGSSGPVIAAGSTGSIPATTRFLSAIAAMPNGAVVLPGLDRSLGDAVWQRIGAGDSGDETLSLCTHPQYGLARLLKTMNRSRSQVRQIGEPGQKERSALLSLALLPAQDTGQWQDRQAAPVSGLQGMALIEASNERTEALAIAIALRETLETPGKSAALVTPDRLLAQRVTCELSRFDIAIDDSGGMPLLQSRPARLARLALAAATGAGDPVVLAALAKEPAVCGANAGKGERLAALFELACLRDAIIVPRAGTLQAAVLLAEANAPKTPFLPAEVAAMVPQDWEGLAQFSGRIDLALEPLWRLRDAGAEAETATMLAALELALEALVLPQAQEAFYREAGGAELKALFEAAALMAGAELGVVADEFCDVFDALLGTETVRDNRRHHPRLAILGPLEARLQSFDRVILGGLNEGAWPAQTRNDPFLNRPMKAEIGLSTPERRTGQAAHDFEQLCGQGEVILSRSMRSGTTPTIASRWVQRLMVLAGEAAAKQVVAAGQRYVDLARLIDKPGGEPRRIGRPNPKPQVALRPRRLSVTEIETWIRDPYAIHAKHILGLSPLPPLERTADPSLRGQIYHAIMARFVDETAGGAARQALLEATARQIFERYNLPKDVVAVWLPRFLEIGALFIDWENERRPQVLLSHCEVSGRMVIENTGFTLRGRADRIDLLADGTLAILDYKTGTRPSEKQARGLSPQLALEAAMAKRGAFAAVAGKDASSLRYVRLRRGEELVAKEICEKNGSGAMELAQRALAQLTIHVETYQKPEQGYRSRAAPMFEADISGDYDHLARVREWASGEAENGDE